MAAIISMQSLKSKKSYKFIRFLFDFLAGSKVNYLQIGLLCMGIYVAKKRRGGVIEFCQVVRALCPTLLFHLNGLKS